MLNQSVMFQQLLEEFGELVARKVAQQVSPGSSSRPRLCTVAEAAVYLCRSKASIRHMIAQKKLEVVRDGRLVRLKFQDLDDWIEKQKGGQ
jgi:excisionase family DNA binding protein